MKQIRQLMMFAICMFGVAVWAQQAQPAQSGEHQHKGQGHGTMSADEHLQMLSQKLNLTDDQKAKIKPILEQHMKDRDAIMKDTSLTSEQKHAKMKASMDTVHAQMDPILNDEQKKQFAEMMQDMHGQGKGGMHDHGDHGQNKNDSSPK